MLSDTLDNIKQFAKEHGNYDPILIIKALSQDNFSHERDTLECVKCTNCVFRANCVVNIPMGDFNNNVIVSKENYYDLMEYIREQYPEYFI